MTDPLHVGVDEGIRLTADAVFRFLNAER